MVGPGEESVSMALGVRSGVGGPMLKCGVDRSRLALLRAGKRLSRFQQAWQPRPTIGDPQLLSHRLKAGPDMMLLKWLYHILRRQMAQDVVVLRGNICFKSLLSGSVKQNQRGCLRRK